VQYLNWFFRTEEIAHSTIEKRTSVAIPMMRSRITRKILSERSVIASNVGITKIAASRKNFSLKGKLQ